LNVIKSSNSSGLVKRYSNTEFAEDTAATIVINVGDVDEKPAFVNAPIPYQAVVPVEAPIGYTVYRFIARDELGDKDGDTGIVYTMINSDREWREGGNLKTKIYFQLQTCSKWHV